MRNVWNLMRRDLVAVKGFRAFWIYLFFLLFAVPVSQSNPPFAALFALFPVLLYVSYIFSSDQRYNVERFFASLPVRRRDIVFSRYAAIFLGQVGILTFIYLAGAILAALGVPRFKPLSLNLAAFSAAVFCVAFGIALVLYFALGDLKARISMMILVMVPSLLGSWFLVPPGLPGIGNLNMPHVSIQLSAVACVVIILCALAFYAGTIPIAVGVYQKRDL